MANFLEKGVKDVLTKQEQLNGAEYSFPRRERGYATSQYLNTPDAIGVHHSR